MSRMRRVAVAAVIACTVALAGCAQDPGAGDELSALVVSAADSVSTGDLATASSRLDELEARVTAERDAGTLTAEQADAALATIATIRAELAAQASPSPAPEATPTEESTPADNSGPGDNNGNGNGNGKPGPPDKEKGPGKDKP